MTRGGYVVGSHEDMLVWKSQGTRHCVYVSGQQDELVVLVFPSIYGQHGSGDNSEEKKLHGNKSLTGCRD